LDYFPDLLNVENDSLRKEIEEHLRNRLDNRKSAAIAALRETVNTWLSKAVIGFKERSFNKLDSFLIDISKNKAEVVYALAEKVFKFDKIKDSIKQGNFIMISDLWSVYLNNPELPPAPISFNEFLSSIKDYCKGHRCVFRVNDELIWIPECSGNGETPSLDENSGVAPIFIIDEKAKSEGFIDWPVKQFLEKLREKEGREGNSRYYIRYKRPSGEDVRVSVDEALMEKERDYWLFYTEGCFEREVLRAYIKQILIDGIDQSSIPSIERPPGTEVEVKVIASEEMDKLIYGINNTMKEVPSPGAEYHFKVEVPKDPGDYTLSIKAIFKSRTEDQRTVTINVKGKRKKECGPRYRVSQGDSIKRIRILNAKEAESLLKYLWGQRKLSLTLSVSATQKADEGEISLNIRYMIRENSPYNNVLRLLKALEDLAPSVDAVFEFLEPVNADDDMVQKFKVWHPQFTVICEE
jgi:hypothetical protein